MDEMPCEKLRDLRDENDNDWEIIEWNTDRAGVSTKSLISICDVTVGIMETLKSAVANERIFDLPVYVKLTVMALSKENLQY